jgi:nitroreductase
MKTVFEAMRERNCIREFGDELVPMQALRELVQSAGCAPSSKNTQPWRLYLVQGAALEAIRADYLAAFDGKQPARHDYKYSPEPLPEPWSSRARACGIGILKHKGIGREDIDKRKAHDRANFEFFGAKQVFFLGTQTSEYSYGTFLDCGFVLNNLMLGLDSLGYGSCPQYSGVAYPDILRKHIDGSDGTMFIAALSFGKAKASAHVNEYRPPRLPLEEWFQVIE